MASRAARFPLMDALRALAALSVVGFHAVHQSNLQYRDTILRPFTAHLDVGVSIFFVISGVLLYRPFVAARLSGAPRPPTIPYAWRRFLRIVPAYWVILTLAALALTLSSVFDMPWTYYGFAQIYRGYSVGGGLGQAWTLCVEVTFYAFLPLWALGLRRVRGGVATELLALGALYVASVGYQVFALGHADAAQLQGPAGPWLMPLPNQLDTFALGMALAVLSAAPRSEAGHERIARLAPWGWVLALVAYIAVSVGIGLTGKVGQRPSDLQWLVHHQLYGLVGFGLLAPVVFDGGGLLRRVLAHRSLLWMGLISYGLYLVHVPVYTYLERHGVSPTTDFPIYVLGGLGLSVALAAASYYAIERPSLRLKGLIGGRPRDEVAAVSAPAAPPELEDSPVGAGSSLSSRRGPQG